MSIPAIQAEELKQRLDAGDNLFLLDVREEDEFEISNIGGHPDSARRTAGARAGTRCQPRDYCAVQNGNTQRESGAASEQCRNFRTSAASPAGFTPGRIGWTRESENTSRIWLVFRAPRTLSPHLR